MVGGGRRYIILMETSSSFFLHSCILLPRGVLFKLAFQVSSSLECPLRARISVSHLPIPGLGRHPTARLPCLAQQRRLLCSLLCSASCRDQTQLCFPRPREFLVSSRSHESHLKPYYSSRLSVTQRESLIVFLSECAGSFGQVICRNP